MKYMGSKARIKGEILPIILKNRKPNQFYVEPFAGGMNVICDVDGNRIANDNNEYLIEMWKGLVSGENYTREISKGMYDIARQLYKDEVSELENYAFMSMGLIGWIGFMASANGKFFDGGYSGIVKTKIGTTRNYIDESIRNIERQIEKMKGVIFFNEAYFNFIIPEKSIIYCDIPYKGTTQYSTSKGFNHDYFWDWARWCKKAGHEIFISEYEAPDDFICVWEKEVKSSLSANGKSGNSKKSIEKLFTL